MCIYRITICLRTKRSVFRTLRDGQSFVQADATRMACVFMPGPMSTASRSSMGVIILVIAEVFRAGTRLDEEQSLTV
jgi:hypothetical protein